jgi:hypothetical protein
MARTAYDSDAPSEKSTLAPGTQAKLKERADREDAAFRAQDDMLFRRATEGVPDQETLDAVLALGGDATRSSPVREQVLPDADPGLTTTTGAYRSPIDPTTAAVPASEHSTVAREVGGYPTVGSSAHGEPEDRWASPGEGSIIDRLKGLPTQEEYRAKEAERMAELAPKNDAPPPPVQAAPPPPPERRPTR